MPRKIRPTMLCLLAFAACSSDPRQLLVGSWGLDLSKIDEEVEAAGELSILARYAAEARRERMSQIHVEFTADGRATMHGTGFDGTGSYAVDAVDGDRLTVRIALPGLPELPMQITLHGHRRMTMQSADQLLSMEFVRR